MVYEHRQRQGAMHDLLEQRMTADKFAFNFMWTAFWQHQLNACSSEQSMTQQLHLRICWSYQSKECAILLLPHTGVGDLITVQQRNIEELGFPESLHGKADGLFLDLPGPWHVRP